MSAPPAIGIIPARYEASRFPGKLLAKLEGKTIIEHVYRQAEKSRRLTQLWVATDDQRIQQVVRAFGGRVTMSSARPQSGTERIAEVCHNWPAEVIVNIQGDEPLLRGEMIDQVVEELFSSPELVVVTLMKEIEDPSELADPNIVKVVTDRNGFALYFSRALIPFDGGRAQKPFFKHIGLYGYRKSFLSVFISLSKGELEEREKLEQLRVLENGYKIKVLRTNYDTIAIDTPEDLEKVRKIVKKRLGAGKASRRLR